MKQKSWYSAPEAELWVVRFERNLLQVSPFNVDNNEKPIEEEDEDF